MIGVLDRAGGQWPSSGVAGGLLVLLLVGGLVTYKSSSALRQIVAGWKATVLIASMAWLVAVAGGLAIG